MCFEVMKRDVFQAIADPTRRAILARLTAGEASVAELAEPFALAQPTGMVVRGALLIGASCLVTGLLLIGLTGAASRLIAAMRRPR